MNTGNTSSQKCVPFSFDIELKEGMFKAVPSDEGPSCRIKNLQQLYGMDLFRSYHYINKEKKRSSFFFTSQANSSSCDIQKDNFGPKDWDKKCNKVLTNNATENDLSSKRDRTSVYSGTKSLQVLTNDAAENYSASKRDQTSVCSGKKSLPVLTNDASEKYLSSSKKQTFVNSDPKYSKVSTNAAESSLSSKRHQTFVNSGTKSLQVSANDAVENYLSSKVNRRSLYSGKKSLQVIPSLACLCLRVLKKNIDHNKNFQKIPYEQLKPVLQCCRPAQLRTIEKYNSHLLQSTDELWQAICQKEYRNLKRVSSDTWRDHYWKTQEELDKKLKNVTTVISASMHKTAAERQVKLTPVETPERPRKKKIKLSTPEPKDVEILFKASNVHRVTQKENLVPTHQELMKKFFGRH